MVLCETNVIQVGQSVIGSLVDNLDGTHTFYPGDGTNTTFDTRSLSNASFSSSTGEVTLTMSDGTTYTYSIDVPTDTTLLASAFLDEDNPTLAEVNTYLASNQQPVGSVLAYSTLSGGYYVWIVKSDNTARLIENNNIASLLVPHIANGVHDELDIAGDMDIAGAINMANNQQITIKNSGGTPVTLATLSNADVLKFGNDVINIQGTRVGIGTAAPNATLTIAQLVDGVDNGLTIAPVSGHNFDIYIDASDNVLFRKNAVGVVSISNAGVFTTTKDTNLGNGALTVNSAAQSVLLKRPVLDIVGTTSTKIIQSSGDAAHWIEYAGSTGALEFKGTQAGYGIVLPNNTSISMVSSGGASIQLMRLTGSNHAYIGPTTFTTTVSSITLASGNYVKAQVSNATSDGYYTSATFNKEGLGIDLNDNVVVTGDITVSGSATLGGVFTVDDITGITSANSMTVATKLVVSTPTVPATIGAAGTKGQISWDSGYIYICTATNTWRRAALTTW